jgi:hypothetical protein
VPESVDPTWPIGVLTWWVEQGDAALSKRFSGSTHLLRLKSRD